MAKSMPSPSTLNSIGIPSIISPKEKWPDSFFQIISSKFISDYYGNTLAEPLVLSYSMNDYIPGGEISGKIAKELFEIVYTQGGDPAQIVAQRGMKQVTDTGAIEVAVDKVISDNSDKVENAKLNPKLAGWFVGQVMKSMGGKANPKAVNELVTSKLGL